MTGRDINPQYRNSAIAVTFIAVGVVLVLFQIFDIRVGGDWWPLVILVPGLIMVGFAFSGGRANAGAAVAGSLVTMTGVIMAYCVATQHWEFWAYAWALYPVATGLALIAAGGRNDDDAMVKSGVQTARWGAIVFVVGLAFFELLIFGSLSGYLLPAILILVGGGMLWSQTRGRSDDMWRNPFERTAAPEPAPPPAPAALRPAPSPAPRAAPPPAPAALRPAPSPAPRAAPAPAQRAAPAPPPRAAAAPPPPAVAEPPPPTAARPPPPADEVFPPDELPHTPAPPEAAFPPDEQSPASGAAPKRGTRSTRSRKPPAA